MVTRTLEGRTALVTGGGTGIGFGCARRLLEHGARVTLAARREKVLERAAGKLRAEINGAEVITVKCDVTIEEDVAAAVAAAADADGHLDIAVANAGSAAPGPILALGAEHWRFASDLNILGSALTIKRSALSMRDRGGSIVAISSVEGFKVARHMPSYSVTKAGLEMLVRCAALELAPFGVRVNCIQPGFVPTEATDQIFGEAEQQEFIRDTPLQRPGRPEEIGDGLVFLCAPASSWITGQILAIDGGMAIPVGENFEGLSRRIWGDELIDHLEGPAPRQPAPNRSVTADR